MQIRDGRTSTEVLRSTRVDEHGDEQHVAEEFAVLDRVGRLQLPHDFVQALELRDRVRLALEPDHVGVWPGHEGERMPLARRPRAPRPHADAAAARAARGRGIRRRPATHRSRRAATPDSDADSRPEEER